MQDDYTQSGPGGSGSTGLPSGEELREAAGKVAGTVREEYDQLREEVAHAAHETQTTVRRGAREYADEQRAAAADTVRAIASALYSSGDTLDSQGRDTVAALWRRGAAGAQEVAQWLEDKSAGDLWQQAQTYARRQPAVSFGGAMVAGFLLARLLKSSATQPEGYAAAREFEPPAPRERASAPAATTPTTGTSDSYGG